MNGILVATSSMNITIGQDNHFASFFLAVFGLPLVTKSQKNEREGEMMSRVRKNHRKIMQRSKFFVKYN